MDEHRKRLFSYSMDGEQWSISVSATSEADARRRLSLAAMGSYNGELIASIPAFLGVDWVLNLVCGVRNLLRGGER